MKRKLLAFVAGSAMVVGVGLASAAPASAFPIYEDGNYSGYAYQATWAQKDGLGTVNGKGSSMKAPSGGKRFYEDRGYSGRSVVLRGDVQYLSNVTTGLGWLQNWNDRIESYN